MHSAPAVNFPLGRSRFQGGLVGVLIACGVLTVSAWVLQADTLGPRHWLAAGVCLMTSVLAAWHGWRSAQGSLAWDGAAWHWTGDVPARLVKPEVVIDFQQVLLLRLRDPAGAFVTWVWLDQALSPLHWVALRRAIYTRTRRPGVDAADALSSPDDAARPV